MLVRMDKEATEQWKRSLPQHKKPGRGMWEVLDYGDVVVHVMTAEERDYYGKKGCGEVQPKPKPFKKPNYQLLLLATHSIQHVAYVAKIFFYNFFAVSSTLLSIKSNYIHF